MGRGNWYPGYDVNDSEVVYVELVGHCEDQDEYDDAWSLFKWHLESILGQSYHVESDLRNVPYQVRESVSRGSSLLAYNGLFCLVCDEQGDMGHLGIGLIVREGAPAFARRRLSREAKRIFDRVSTAYNCRVRTSAWTSAAY